MLDVQAVSAYKGRVYDNLLKSGIEILDVQTRYESFRKVIFRTTGPIKIYVDPWNRQGTYVWGGPYLVKVDEEGGC